MNRFQFLVVALGMAAFVVLTSFALRAPADLHPNKDGPAWRVSDYRLDRAFRVPVQLNQGSVTCQIPATGGIIITQVRTVASGILTIAVNGVVEQFWIPGNTLSSFPFDLNPPIIARPNDVITISTDNPGATWTIAGYTTYLGET